MAKTNSEARGHRPRARQPRPLLLADTPTGELDSQTSRDILGLFRQLVKEQRVSVLMVSHDPLVDEYADTVLHLSDGQIV